jgi:hypothetical protein
VVNGHYHEKLTPASIDAILDGLTLDGATHDHDAIATDGH